jgi:uncharacterized membrane protein (UPF0182 family)
MLHPVRVPWQTRVGSALGRWLRPAVLAVVVVIAAWLVLRTVVTVVTTHLWFDSVHAGPVYTTVLRAETELFIVFGILAGVAGGLTLRAVRRIRPRLAVDRDVHSARWSFRQHEHRLWSVLLLAAVVIPAYLVGRRAAGQWQAYLLWRHAAPWHVVDPQFHKDASFFVEVYPFHALVVGLLTRIVVISLLIALAAGFAYGGWRFRGPGARTTRSMTRLVSLLLAVYLVLRGAGYWISRYAVITSQRGPVTGPSYTDVHAVLPGRTALLVISLVCAVLLVVNVLTVGRIRLLAAAVVVMIVGAVVVGSAWPSLVQRLREQPSAATVDLGEIRHNQQATLHAFGLSGDVRTVADHPSSTLHGKALQDEVAGAAQIRVLDPNRLSPTFNVKQELQSYYGFKSTLDIDHYPLGGTSRDVALAVRELRTQGIPHSSWVNNHLFYTHGYGLVAAPTDAMDPRTESPDFLDAGIPPAQQIPVTQPAIYFGQQSPAYSIVGEPAGNHHHLEFDHPGGNGTESAHTTYTGAGGIPIGSTLRKLLFAVRLGSANILFSSDVNSASQLLMVRNPRARVAQVAPWLTLDGDVYPAVVDGRIQWVVDGYTSSSTYPDSQQVNLGQAARTTLTTQGATVGQPNRQVNYLRNSVKATVDAYTGQVRLYEWHENQAPDPLLKTWESVFPGLVQPQSSMPAALLPHLRYPQDLFDVQRSLLAQYHVTQAPDFYSGNDFWKVPTDSTVAANHQFNSGSSGGGAAPAEPPTYMTMALNGTGPQRYTLSSPMVTLNRRDLAAFISVDAEPGPDYGRFTVLDYPGGSGGEAPSQVQNDIESSTKISEALTLQRGGNSKVVLGDLVAVPVAGRLLYVEPVYTQAAGSTSFPILRHVIALYGDGDPAFDDTLAPALRQAVASGAAG